MKKAFVLILLVVAMIAFMPVLSDAQTNNSPNNYRLFNAWSVPVGGYSDSTSVPYLTGRVDTLPNWRSAKTTIVAAAAKLLSITFYATDTIHATVVVKTKVRGADTSTYTAILTDSLYNWSGTVKTNYLRELSLKDGDSDLFDNLDQEFIIIITHTAVGETDYGNDTQGTAVRRVRLNWAQ